ncbi:phage major capsid protein, P2 family [Brevundimonas sp. UBA7664]|uniref:phage major capsid protein, P2 family n=1 Tax=Brevundimonas sp. UBA7664 TaxID=1946141 RepID=UPI0025BEE089|nr:phage major capsid protein, P2 family [Brevundimonas sp. UBA7664]
MNRATRIAFNAFLDQQAALNGEDPDTVRTGKQFTVDPSIQQKLIDKAGESSEFLKAVNIVPVEEMQGAKLGLGVNTPIAGRTNTAGGTPRATVDPSGLDEQGYACKQTNSDTHLTYAKLDMWAKFPDFQTRIRDAIVRQQARDRIMIGFNGVSAAATTDKGANPLLQDVNVGWLEHYRAYDAGSRVLDEGEVEDDLIIIDPVDGDYKNINALIMDAVHSLMPAWSRNDTELVAILSDDLQHDTFFPLVNNNLEPTETMAADLIIGAKRVGGKKAAAVPFFPNGSIFITRLDNLSIYEQSGKRRRTIVDKAELDRVQTFESSNDAYVVEDYDFGCFIENIQFGRTPD